MTRVVVSARVKRRLVDRCGNDSFDYASGRQLDGSLDRQAAESPGVSGAFVSAPAPDRFGHLEAATFRADHHNVTTLANPGVGERFSDDLGSNSAGITHGHREAGLHNRYSLKDT